DTLPSGPTARSPAPSRLAGSACGVIVPSGAIRKSSSSAELGLVNTALRATSQTLHPRPRPSLAHPRLLRGQPALVSVDPHQDATSRQAPFPAIGISPLQTSEKSSWRNPTPFTGGRSRARLDRLSDSCYAQAMKLIARIQLLPDQDAAAKLRATMETFNAAA